MSALRAMKLWMVLMALPAQAVFLSPEGTGEVLLVPYYTVNNGLNTLVALTNTSGESKAIKITFRESHNGYAALTYNVYLSAFEAWSFALVPATSTSAEHENETSVLHITSDTSCAPMLNKAGEEFSSDGLVDGPQGLDRIREGFIEIIEMGELEESAVYWAYPGGPLGLTRVCEEFESAWDEGGIWNESNGGDSTRFIKSGSGGLMAEAHLIDVAQGINYSYPAVVLDGFWGEGQLTHVAPGDGRLSLDAAAPETMVFDQEKVLLLNMDSGTAAVNAVLMAEQLHADYALDSIVNGQTELVYTFPTRRFAIENGSETTAAPFATDRRVDSCSNNHYGGSTIEQFVFDRESHSEVVSNSGTGPVPPDTTGVCGSVFVQAFELPSGQGANQGAQPFITGSNNFDWVYGNSVAFSESGWTLINFQNQPLIGSSIDDDQTYLIHGLPVMGLSLFRYTNAAAEMGLLAQYGGAVVPTYQSKIEPTND